MNEMDIPVLVQTIRHKATRDSNRRTQIDPRYALSALLCTTGTETTDVKDGMRFLPSLETSVLSHPRTYRKTSFYSTTSRASHRLVQ
jgi:hypothetical protein